MATCPITGCAADTTNATLALTMWPVWAAAGIQLAFVIVLIIQGLLQRATAPDTAGWRGRIERDVEILTGRLATTREEMARTDDLQKLRQELRADMDKVTGRLDQVVAQNTRILTLVDPQHTGR